MVMPPGEWKTGSIDEESHQHHGIWVVLHLSPKKRGSMEQQLLALAQRLGKRRVPLTYVFASAPVAWMADELARLKVTVQVIDFSHPLGAALHLGRQWLDARPQLIHFHFVRAFSPLVAAARLAGAKVVVNDHVSLTRASDSAAREALKQARDAALNPLVDCRVAVSRFVAESVAEIEHVERSRIDIIENGIDLPRFFDADGSAVKAELGCPGRPLLVCVSRLQEEKGVESAIRAMPLIAHRALLALVGDGPEGARWQALAVELGVDDSVRFLGLRDDVERLLAAADVVVVPSHWDEAFGLAVVEGMAAGKPVVVTASGAMPEIVGDTGVVVPRRDPGALAGAITRLLDDALLCQRLGRAARARVQSRYGMDRYIDQVVALYERLCPDLKVALAA